MVLFIQLRRWKECLFFRTEEVLMRDKIEIPRHILTAGWLQVSAFTSPIWSWLNWWHGGPTFQKEKQKGPQISYRAKFLDQVKSGGSAILQSIIHRQSSKHAQYKKTKFQEGAKEMQEEEIILKTVVLRVAEEFPDNR